jgi:hypothetical protein
LAGRSLGDCLLRPGLFDQLVDRGLGHWTLADIEILDGLLSRWPA